MIVFDKSQFWFHFVHSRLPSPKQSRKKIKQVLNFFFTIGFIAQVKTLNKIQEKILYSVGFMPNQQRLTFTFANIICRQSFIVDFVKSIYCNIQLFKALKKRFPLEYIKHIYTYSVITLNMLQVYNKHISWNLLHGTCQ